MRAVLHSVAVALPERVLANADLAAAFPDWSVDKIADKTGIIERRISAPDETAADLAVAAGQRLLATGIDPASIDAVLFCTQSPDYLLPTSACLIQQRLGLPTACAALDFNLGCSGYVYGLGLAKGLIASGQARRVLLLTGDTYTKFIRDDDRSVRTLFGDGATASLIVGVETDGPASGGLIGKLVYGSDGRGGCNLIVASGGLRGRGLDERAPTGPRPELFMDGPEIFKFTLDIVPATIARLLDGTGLAQGDIDLWVFHQANRYMLEHLRRKLGIPPERFAVHLEKTGNTVSSTIPIVLDELQRSGRLRPGLRLGLVGFGVGYSWGAALVDWT
jgi:3-oxoacyl-[acyl-carrier-protein] synthase-3